MNKCPVCGAENGTCGMQALYLPPLDLASPSPPTPPSPEKAQARAERMARIAQEVEARRRAMGAE